MPYGLYISAAGADAQSQRLQILSHNLANADTPGFKREFAILQAEEAEAIEQGEAEAGSGSVNDVGGGVSLVETMTDFSRGSFRPTGIETDMAIDGEGFFAIQKDGQQFLTRAGNFRVSSTGQFQTDEGHVVLSTGGDPITINPNQPWRLFENGVISQEGAKIPIALVRPQSLGDLVKAGENLFSSLSDVLPVNSNARRVLNGHLEQSTVKPTLEMMELIETSRAYEANVRMIQNQDQMLGALVNRVLRQQ